jgi:hypothetical protein
MAVADHLLDAMLWVGPGKTRSTICAILYDVLRNGVDAPLSVRLLQHYVEGSSTPYVLDEVPLDWQEWILKDVHRRKLREGGPYEMKAYHHQAPYDLRHTFGTFQLRFGPSIAGKTWYAVSDTYKFDYDCSKRDPQSNRHGFLLRGWRGDKVQQLREHLPTRVYKHKCGFSERFVVERQKEGYFLLIPQAVLAELGTKFEVTGEFSR